MFTHRIIAPDFTYQSRFAFWFRIFADAYMADHNARVDVGL